MPNAVKKQQEPTTVVAESPETLPGRLKSIGGSMSDDWNNILANQTVGALWLKHSSPEDRQKQLNATVAALMGIGPKDELEGMLAGQLIACHNASMECYRRAMIARADLRGPAREPQPSEQALANLRHAARSAQPPSRQGPAAGHRRACHRQSRAARPSSATSPTRGVGSPRNQRINPMHRSRHAMPGHRDAEQHRSGAGSRADRRRYGVRPSAGCMGPVVVRRRAITTPSRMGGIRPRRLGTGRSSPR